MLRRLATISACAIAVCLLGAGTAHADIRILEDARGDVWAMDNPEPGQHTQKPNRRYDDIIRSTFAHNARNVVVRTKFVELDPVGRTWVMATHLKSDVGVRRFWVFAGPGSRAGELMRGDGAPMPCANHRIDYVENLVEVQIPRTCLGNPRWVQGTLAAGTETQNGIFFADNPVNDGPTVRLPSFTTRIFRG